MRFHAPGRFIPIFAAMALASLSACSNGSGTPDATVDLTVPPDFTTPPDLTPPPPDLTPPPPARLSTDVQPIFNTFCSTCHTQAPFSAGLNLSAGNSHGALVGITSSQCAITANPNQTRVVVNNATQSYLIDKLTGAATICGMQMPRNAPPLSTAQIDTIRSWINDGAQNN